MGTVDQVSNMMQQMRVFPPASFAQKKLRLVIDLDNTLVHVTRTLTTPDVKLFWADLRDVQTKSPFFTDHENEVFYFKTKKNVRYVKFRPGCFEFLTEASKYFELWIDTLAKRSYAQGVVDMIEHRCGPIIGKRMLTRHDHLVASTKYLDYHHCHNTLIIDDNIASVWRNTANLVPISPFYYFSPQPDTTAAPTFSFAFSSSSSSPSPSFSSVVPSSTSSSSATFSTFDTILHLIKRVHKDYMTSEDNVSVQHLLLQELSCGAGEISGRNCAVADVCDDDVAGHLNSNCVFARSCFAAAGLDNENDYCLG